VTGPDAADFLQGQCTNDLAGLVAGGPPAYGLWLNVKGKVLADSFVFLRGDPAEFWLGSYYSSSDTIKQRLDSHIIADDVVVEDFTADWAGFTLYGDAAGGALLAPAAGSFVFRGRRADEATRDWVFPATERGRVLERLSHLVEISAAEAARRRIAAAIPAVPCDIGPGDLPNEAGLETDAISYTKGCYLGQEVMARLKSMGQVRRRLLRVRTSAAPTDLPAPLFAGARQVGELRSVAAEPGGTAIGLAMLSRLQVKQDTALSYAVDGPSQVQLIDTP
jgi:folate-binding protein YgfZ